MRGRIVIVTPEGWALHRAAVAELGLEEPEATTRAVADRPEGRWVMRVGGGGAGGLAVFGHDWVAAVERLSGVLRRLPQGVTIRATLVRWRLLGAEAVTVVCRPGDLADFFARHLEAERNSQLA